MNLDYAFGEV